MENFDVVISKFLEVVKKYSGKMPVFSFNYNTSEVVLKSATSGFLKQLYKDDKVNASLREEGIIINYFK